MSSAPERRLRQVVLDHARAETRRSFAPTLCAEPLDLAAAPADARREIELVRGVWWDHTLRLEVVQALIRPLLDAGADPLVWLIRPHDRTEEDQLWSGAVHDAGRELGLDLALYAVSKRAWHEPRTGAGRTWQRPIRKR